MTKDPSAEVRTMAGTGDLWEVTNPLWFRRRNQDPNGEGPALGVWAHRAGQHDLEAPGGQENSAGTQPER